MVSSTPTYYEHLVLTQCLLPLCVSNKCVCVCACSFLSSLLTAVLSHHLAWVFTVTRQHSSDSNSRHGKQQSSRSVSLIGRDIITRSLYSNLFQIYRTFFTLFVCVSLSSCFRFRSLQLGVLAESHPYNPLWAQLG